MKKWSAFACPPAAFVLIGLGIFFQGHGRLSVYLPILILFTLILGFYLILADKTLQTVNQKLLFSTGYFFYIIAFSMAGGFIAGLLFGMPPPH